MRTEESMNARRSRTTPSEPAIEPALSGVGNEAKARVVLPRPLEYQGPTMTSLVASLKRVVHPFSSKAIATASLVEGNLKGSGVAFRCLFVHNCSFNDHLKQRMYEGDATTIRKRRIVIPALRRQIRKRAGDFDLCVAVLPRFYDRVFGDLCDLKGPEEVCQVIDTSGGWEVMRQRFVKKKRQITNNFDERYGLSYRITNDPKDFDLFYHRMFAPHIRRRYGELSHIESYDEMKEFFFKGRLLFVTKDDKPLAGALSLVEGKSLVFRRSGVLDGEEENVKGGAQTALYYFQLRYAAENGFTSVDTMKSVAFMNDGVFRHKAEWGARALPDQEAESIVFFFAPGPREKIARFFDANPIVVDSGSYLRGVVGDPHGTKPTPPDEVLKRLHTRGLRDVLVYGQEAVRTIPVVEEALAAPAGARVDKASSDR
jgi:hypothetical protein